MEHHIFDYIWMVDQWFLDVPAITKPFFMSYFLMKIPHLDGWTIDGAMCPSKQR